MKLVYLFCAFLTIFFSGCNSKKRLAEIKALQEARDKATAISGSLEKQASELTEVIISQKKIREYQQKEIETKEVEIESQKSTIEKLSASEYTVVQVEYATDRNYIKKMGLEMIMEKSDQV